MRAPRIMRALVAAAAPRARRPRDQSWRRRELNASLSPPLLLPPLLPPLLVLHRGATVFELLPPLNNCPLFRYPHTEPFLTRHEIERCKDRKRTCGEAPQMRFPFDGEFPTVDDVPSRREKRQPSLNLPPSSFSSSLQNQQACCRRLAPQQ